MRDKLAEVSRDRLKLFCEKKIKTTMIGALDTIEKNMGDLWQSNSAESLEMRNRFEIIRQAILDNGNRQIRGLSEEFNRYKIEWLTSHITLSIGRKEDGNRS